MPLDDFLFLIVLGFISYRIAGLLVWDKGPFGVFKKIQAYFGKRASKAGKNSVAFQIAEILNCVHCTGIYISFLLTFMMQPESPVWFIAYWACIAGIQSFLSSVLVRSDL